MSILGTFMDKLTNQTLTGVTLSTFNHSLQTAPDLTLANLKSAVSATAPGALIAVGANASLATIGLQAASVSLGSNLAFFDVWNILWWSPVR